MSSSVINVGMEEVVEVVDTVVSAVGDVVVIVSVGVIEVGETIDKGRVEIVLALFCCEICTF